MDDERRRKLVERVERDGRGRKKRLADMGFARSTYYRWRGKSKTGSPEPKERPRKRVWNRLTSAEVDIVVSMALRHPELSPRLLAVKMTDDGPFAVSESTVYRILKHRGLIRPRPLEERPAGKEWSHKTSRVDEIWQTDATHFLVKGWGRYKAIPVLDDYSRKLMAMPMKPDETGGSISDALEEALENAEKEGHNGTGMPVLLSDNGPGFAGGELAGYLRARSMRHIFGAPYHPQTQGKVERLNRWVAF